SSISSVTYPKLCVLHGVTSLLQMIRSLLRCVPSVRSEAVRSLSSAPEAIDDESKPWLNPWKRALPEKTSTLTSVEEVKIDWSYVERLMPHDVVPPLPVHKSYPTPSGWQPPQGKASTSFLPAIPSCSCKSILFHGFI
ncbi:hypothetical protein GCK32_022277, partial [Trichostrongylus colubriformis]